MFLFLSVPIGNAQTLLGKVIDAQTKEPLEMASVYFDNTTIGTVTNEKGEFSIDYNDAIQSTLIISILGYQKTYINDYREKTEVLVSLTEALNELDEVEISYDDGMTRKQKLKLFKENFLGTSKFARSCKIINEDAIFLRYDKDDKKLYASAKQPLKIINKALAYEISYDLGDYEILFQYIDLNENIFNIRQVAYYGNVFYKDLNQNEPKKRILKNREKAYDASVQRFMRALYYKDFKEKGYLFGEGGFKINPYKYLTLSKKDSSNLVTAKLEKPVAIYYKDAISFIQTVVPEFKINRYGNHTPVTSVMFGGAMGTKRVGDMLPLDFHMD